MMPALLEAKKAHILKSVRFLFETLATGTEEEEEMVPMFHLVLEDGKEQVIAAPLWNEETKDRITATMRKRAVEARAVLVAFIAEAWTLRGSPEHPVDLEARPSEHPEREEILMVTFDTREGCEVTYFPILREAGKRSLGKPETIRQGVVGRFAGILAEPN